MPNLFETLKKYEGKAKQKVKNKLNHNSPFGTLTDDEIAMVLALRAKNIRISKEIKQKEFSDVAELSSKSTYSNFEQKGTISLINFIKVMRAFGKLEELDGLLQPTVSEKIKQIDSKVKKRVV